MIFHARGGETQTEFPSITFSILALKNTVNVCMIECFKPEKTADAFSANISLLSSVCRTKRLVMQIAETYAVVADRHRPRRPWNYAHNFRWKRLLREISFDVHPDDSVLRMGRLVYGVD